MELKRDNITVETDNNILKDVWAASEHDSLDTDETGITLGVKLGFVAVILVLAVVFMAWFAIRRSETDMTRLLEEKGASLMMTFDSALRTGMRSSSGLTVQTLFEEMSKSPDIVFIAVTMPDGVILAHSDRSRIGEEMTLDNRHLTPEKIAELAPGDDEKSFMAYAEQVPVFLVYRNFTLGNKNWPEDVPEPIIFLGMDSAPFNITRVQNRNYIIIISIVTLITGFIGLLVFSFAQKAAESRRSQRLAEGEAKRLAVEVARNEKLAAVGTLAAGVAHEIRNPLSSIKGYATYFQYRFAEGSEDREAAVVLAREVDRLNRVITDLLGLSNQAKMKVSAMRPQDVIEHVSRLLRPTLIEREITVHLRFAKDIPVINGDMEKLSQCILNLCLNAIESMSKGGELTLAMTGGKKYICIVVQDNGTGISPEIKTRIFDPYFTTKGSGTGLGLPMVHKIVKGHGGQIGVYSRLAEGDRPGQTIFHIWLPISGKEQNDGKAKKGRLPGG